MEALHQQTDAVLIGESGFKGGEYLIIDQRLAGGGGVGAVGMQWAILPVVGTGSYGKRDKG